MRGEALNFFYQNCNTRNWRYAPKGVFWCFLDPLKAGGGGTLSKKKSKFICLSPPWVAVLKL
jgi:hypothetical protein